MEARSLFIIAVLILAALIKASVKNTARRGGKTTGKPIGKNGERMAQAQDAPQRSVPPRRSMSPPDMPDAACVVCDNTGEDHFAHDKAQRIAQLDDFLKNGIIDKAVAQANAEHIHGKAITPYLLAHIKDMTEGKSFAANLELAYNNAHAASKIAVAYTKL